MAAVPIHLLSWYLSSLQNLFDIVFCYFPITFKPPPGDPYGIAAEDLRASLLFVQHTFAAETPHRWRSFQIVSNCCPLFWSNGTASLSRKAICELWQPQGQCHSCQDDSPSLSLLALADHSGHNSLMPSCLRKQSSQWFWRRVVESVKNRGHHSFMPKFLCYSDP